MKRFILKLFFIIFFICSVEKNYAAALTTGHTDSTSKSFLANMVPFRASMPERMTFFETLPCDATWHFQIVPFIGASTNTHALGRYFFPWSDNILTVTSGKDFFEASGDLGIPRDIDSSNFNIFSNATVQPGANANTQYFNSVIGIAPHEKYFGVGLFASGNLAYHDDGSVKWRIECAAPIMEITHTLELTELVRNPVSTIYPLALENTPSVTTMTEAFNQPAFKWGKILPDCQEMKAVGLADIELNMVYTGVTSEICTSETQFGIIIPTGQKPGDTNNKWAGYLWEPFVGNGQHWGIEYGNNISITLSENCERRIACTITATTTYLFPNQQMRTFDLKDKSWSRYITVWPSLASMNSTPDPLYQGSAGVNYLTLNSIVSPRFSFVSTSMISYERGTFTGSFGYTALGRQAEHIDIDDMLKPIAIKGASSGISPTLLPQVSLARTMRYQFSKSDLPGNTDNNYAFAQIKQSDIDKNSAAQPAVLAGILFGCAGYQFNCYESHAILGLGGSYKFSSNNGMPEGWMTWITAHINF